MARQARAEALNGSALRNLRTLDRYRVRVPELGGMGDELCGAFLIPSPVMGRLRVIASGYDGWDHVSVSLENRAPVWAEMEHVKRLFFRPEACCMQLHVPEAAHLSVHPHCLHIWRPHGVEIPRPPAEFVA